LSEEAEQIGLLIAFLSCESSDVHVKRHSDQVPRGEVLHVSWKQRLPLRRERKPSPRIAGGARAQSQLL
jgi:hypothetical protein